MSRLHLILACSLICCLGGCGGNVPIPGPKQVTLAPRSRASSDEADWAIKKYALEELTPTEDEFLIDDGRVEIAPPKEWNRLPRSDKYLVCFTRSDRTGLPRITVTSELFSSSVFEKVTGDNLVEFGKFRFEELTGGDEPAELIESVRALQLGENVWIRYVAPASFRGAEAERQILETVHDGKLYRVELQVISGMLQEHRDAAYAVAAKMRFVEPNAPPAEDAPGEPDITLPPIEGAP